MDIAQKENSLPRSAGYQAIRAARMPHLRADGFSGRDTKSTSCFCLLLLYRPVFFVFPGVFPSGLLSGGLLSDLLVALKRRQKDSDHPKQFILPSGLRTPAVGRASRENGLERTWTERHNREHQRPTEHEEHVDGNIPQLTGKTVAILAQVAGIVSMFPSLGYWTVVVG